MAASLLPGTGGVCAQNRERRRFGGNWVARVTGRLRLSADLVTRTGEGVFFPTVAGITARLAGDQALWAPSRVPGVEVVALDRPILRVAAIEAAVLAGIKGFCR